jgi:hypothetical protein
MKLLIKNEGEFAVKIMTRGAAVGNPDDSNYDNGIKETMVDPGGFAHLEADAVEHITIREYTPTTNTAQPDLYSGGA